MKKFKENFDKLTHSDISALDFPLIDEQLADMKNEITQLYKMLVKQKFTQGDYKELVTLVLLYLSDDKGQNFGNFNRPGACHKACWMAKLLYAIKMVLLQPQLITLTNYFSLCYADGKMPMVYLNYLISSDLNQVIKT